MAALSPTAARIFSSLPNYYSGGEPTLTRLVTAVANELDRVEAYLESAQNGLVPTLADDSLGMLGIWERVFGLPVHPAGVPMAQRQQALKAAIAARSARTTAEWVAAMNRVIGTGSWTHQVGQPGPGQVTITTPFVPGGYLDGIIRAIARRLTPANYEIVFGYSQGWVAGVSHAGDLL